MSDSHKADNPREYQKRLERELVLGGVIIGLIVGGGGIYLLWGAAAALTGLMCFGLFLGIVALVWGMLTLASWLGNRE